MLEEIAEWQEFTNGKRPGVRHTTEGDHEISPGSGERTGASELALIWIGLRLGLWRERPTHL